MKHTLTEIAFGFIIGSVGLGGCIAGCASIPACETVAVVKVLGPRPDPEQITLFDLKDIAGRLKACAATDAGE